MKYRIAAIGLLFLAGVLWWLGSERHTEPKGSFGARMKERDRPKNPRDRVAGDTPLYRVLKLSRKPAAKSKATHAPRQPKDFHLPPIEIEGLSLAAALEKLMAAYDDACHASGEVPLDVVFKIPQEWDRRLNFRLEAMRMDGALRYLGALCGLKVARRGLEYRFEVPEDPKALTERQLQVPPDLLMRLSRDKSERDLRAALLAAGVELDPATEVNFLPASSTLSLATWSGSDLETITSMIDHLNGSPVQQMLASRRLEIPTGVDLKAEELGQLDEAGVRDFLRRMADTQGVEMIAMPKVTARNGEAATLELIREVIYPRPGSTDEFELRNVGQVLKIQSATMGFGHQLDLTFTDTTADMTADVPEFTERTRIESSNYAGDQSTRVLEQIRPDGSRTLLLVTPTLIDATGRPVKPSE